jgi:putative transposase
MVLGYPSDLKDKEWELIEEYFQPKDRRGSARKHPRRRVVEAILYVVKGGVQWRMLPRDFPPWQTVYDHYAKWSKRGVWEAGLDALNALYREKKGRQPQPRYGIVDSQSAKTQYASEERGIDGGKRVKGRKRHIVVDVLGCLLHVQVHAANVHDTVGACEVMRRAREKHPGLEAFSGDADYRGTAVRFADERLGMALHISKRIKDGFAVLPKRWVVERTFSWFGGFRRLSKDFEILAGSAENVIRIAMLKTMLAKCA